MNGDDASWDLAKFERARGTLGVLLNTAKECTDSYRGSQLSQRWIDIEMDILQALEIVRAIQKHLGDIDREFCGACGARLERRPWLHKHVHGQGSTL